MIVDPNDLEHIINELKNEFPQLTRKRNNIIKQLRKNLKKTNYFPAKQNILEWTNPESLTKWHLAYSVSVQNKKIGFSFTPITTFEANSEKHYMQFIEENVLDIEKLGLTVIRVFRSHFISRYRQRTGIELKKPIEVILQFYWGDRITLIESYQQNVKWFLNLEKDGISMVKKRTGYIFFETFIECADIKDDQKIAIQKYIDEIKDPFHYLGLAFTLSLNGYWKNFFSDERMKYMNNLAWQTDKDMYNKFANEIRLYADSIKATLK